MFTWILAQWEEYHTSLMLYGNEYYGVLECNYTLALVHLLTFFVGQEFWRSQITDYLPAVAGVKYLGHWSECQALDCRTRLPTSSHDYAVISVHNL